MPILETDQEGSRATGGSSVPSHEKTNLIQSKLLVEDKPTPLFQGSLGLENAFSKLLPPQPGYSIKAEEDNIDWSLFLAELETKENDMLRV